MNRSLTDIGGGLLLVPQFTLAADTGKGTRPSFSSAAPPDVGAALFGYLLARARPRIQRRSRPFRRRHESGLGKRRAGHLLAAGGAGLNAVLSFIAKVLIIQ